MDAYQQILYIIIPPPPNVNPTLPRKKKKREERKTKSNHIPILPSVDPSILFCSRPLTGSGLKKPSVYLSQQSAKGHDGGCLLFFFKGLEDVVCDGGVGVPGGSGSGSWSDPANGGRARPPAALRISAGAHPFLRQGVFAVRGRRVRGAHGSPLLCPVRRPRLLRQEDKGPPRVRLRLRRHRHPSPQILFVGPRHRHRRRLRLHPVPRRCLVRDPPRRAVRKHPRL